MLSKIYHHLSIRAQIMIVAIAPTLIVTLILVVLAYRENVAGCFTGRPTGRQSRISAADRHH